ncbi:HNH endonuclease [Geoalkalibacter halelectricus]|uniref:HNH endonuclease n=1 Tax=Geoalkalibacter halelectricus TaxID=2847045 RepID=A0ABY5ZJ84_9BACT|nr:HNH endonuclease signature motif containing protein [Geoalkalibacter halelectricus]UWZ79182.1 HNH endonuclease [Geoalkalibacter halelectricus]
MGRRSRRDKPEELRQNLVELLSNFENKLKHDDLRQQVRGLIPVFNTLRDLGSSILPDGESGRDRILLYLRKYPYVHLNGQELMVVSGIDDWARRVRELRVEHGWKILTGVTAKEIVRDAEEVDSLPNGAGLPKMKPDDYILLDERQDREAAHRWKSANRIRKLSLNVQDKILLFLKENIGNEISGEELRYVAKNKSEWARRVRELRTEEGWPVLTKTTGMPELPIGIYVLVSDRQSPKEDRAVKDALRREVFVRDGYECRDCKWTPHQWNRSDPRNLEAHHEKPHAEGGATKKENLITLCNICHDDRHRKRGLLAIPSG